MVYTITLLALTTLLLTPATFRHAGTATPAASPLVDPAAVVAAVAGAEPPATLPGNEDEAIALISWEDHYGQPLEDVPGAWVLTGSNQLPIASVIVFDTPERAEAGLGDFARDSAAATAGDLEAFAIADRGKWACVAIDGPVLLIGQAEPVPGEKDEVVRDRACAVVAEMHAWLAATVTGEPPATPA